MMSVWPGLVTVEIPAGQMGGRGEILFPAAKAQRDESADGRKC